MFFVIIFLFFSNTKVKNPINFKLYIKHTQYKIIDIFYAIYVRGYKSINKLFILIFFVVLVIVINNH